MRTSSKLPLYLVAAFGLLALIAVLWTPAGSAGASAAPRRQAEASPAPEGAEMSARPPEPAARAATIEVAVPSAAERAPRSMVPELELDPSDPNGTEPQGGPVGGVELPRYDDSARSDFEQAFEAESVDALWAPHEEERLRALLESGSGFRGVTSHCRSTLCRVEVSGARGQLPPRGIAALTELATRAGASAAVYLRVERGVERLGAFVPRSAGAR